MKILISYDGSEIANVALKDLHRAGLPAEAQVVLLSVSGVAFAAKPKFGESILANTDSEEDAEKAAQMTIQASQSLRQNFPGWEVRTDLAAGSLVRVITKKAHQWNPDLIVLALQECTAQDQGYLGGLSQRIAIEARCSVRVARAENVETGDAPRVLLCIKDSAYSPAAVRAVASRAWPKGTEVRMFTVVDPFDYSIPEFVDKALRRAQSFHRVIANQLEQTLAFTSSVIREGDPKKMILQEAHEWKPDSIFIAPRGRIWIPRFLPGKISDALVARAKCTVELVRSAEIDARADSLLGMSTPRLPMANTSATRYGLKKTAGNQAKR